MLRISWLFCIFRYSPANKVWNPKRGKFPNKDMAKIQKINEITNFLFLSSECYKRSNPHIARQPSIPLRAQRLQG